MEQTKISIIIPTLCRNTLYELLKKLISQKINEKFEIILIPQYILNQKCLIKDKRIVIIQESPGKGFSYYRNVGIKKVSGNIIVFIDDDETPRNNKWLSNLTHPIIRGNESVTTSGVKIKLGQGYFTDSISLLGFPGGGAIGFKTMWEVDKDNYTKHLCVGNFAISKKCLRKIGVFKNQLMFGNEDVELAERIINLSLKIKYVKKATVIHVARKGYLNFVKWNILRGRSAFQLKTTKNNISDNILNRFKSSFRIIKLTIFSKYAPGVIFFMVNQYAWQLFGYLVEKSKNASHRN